MRTGLISIWKRHLLNLLSNKKYIRICITRAVGDDPIPRRIVVGGILLYYSNLINKVQISVCLSVCLFEHFNLWTYKKLAKNKYHSMNVYKYEKVLKEEKN